MIEIQDIVFDVLITRKRIKNLYLRVEDTTIQASAPYLMKESDIYLFIDKKKDWIYKVYQTKKKRNEEGHLYHGGDYFYLFDKKYPLIKVKANKSSFELKEDSILLFYSSEENAIDYLYKRLDQVLLQMADVYYKKYEYVLKEAGYNLIPEIRAKKMKSKWGVCFIKKNRICISSYLIHYPLECLEYIMLHEMAHFLEANHSKSFYRIIEKNMSNYKSAIEKLKS